MAPVFSIQKLSNMPQEWLINFHTQLLPPVALQGNWQQVMAAGTPGDPPLTRRWPRWQSPDTALIFCCFSGRVSGL